MTTVTSNYAELFTGLGIVSAIFLSALGSILGSAPAGIYVLRSSKTNHYDGAWYKCFGPIVISGVLAIYGFIVAVILAFQLTDSTEQTTIPTTTISTEQTTIPTTTNSTSTEQTATGSLSDRVGYINFMAGLTVGLACLASGYGMGKFIELSMKDMEVGKDYSTKTVTTTTSAVHPQVGFDTNENQNLEPTPEQPLLPMSRMGTNDITMKDDKSSQVGAAPEFNTAYFFVMTYLEAIGLYGFIAALLLIQKA